MAKPINHIAKFLLERISRPVGNKGYDGWFGHSIKVLSADEGSCVAEMTIGEEHVDATGRLHGGCTATLVDMVTALALSTTNKFGVSVAINVSYHQSAKQGEVILLDAKTLRVGKTLAFLALDIRKKGDGSLIATGKHTIFLDRTNVMAPPDNYQQ